MPLGIIALWHLFRFTGSDQTALNKCYLYEDMGSVDFVTRDFMLICSEIAGLFLFFYHVYESLIDPRLY